MHLNIFQDILFVVLLIGVGVIVGFLAGLFGIGGGVMLVPTFIALFPYFGAVHSTVMHGAVGTALALIVPAATMSTYKHYTLGHIDFKLCKIWLPLIIVGALIGAFTLQFMSTTILKIIFTLYLYFALVYTFFKKESTHENDQQPSGPLFYLGGIVIGCLSTFLGVGGGTFTVPFFKIYDFSYQRAVGASAATGMFVGFIGAIAMIVHGWGLPGRAHYSLGYINILAFVLLTPIVMVMSPIGAKTSEVLSSNTLKWIYVAMLFVLAVYMTIKIFHVY